VLSKEHASQVGELERDSERERCGSQEHNERQQFERPSICEMSADEVVEERNADRERDSNEHTRRNSFVPPSFEPQSVDKNACNERDSDDPRPKSNRNDASDHHSESGEHRRADEQLNSKRKR
jgi:hypothetical protein